MRKFTILFIIVIFISCDKDSSIEPITSPVTQKVTLPVYSEPLKDVDNNIYQTVIIGTQVWMAENLKTTKYRNGDIIPNVKDNIEWENQKTGAYCNYNNDESLVVKYGRLYNGFAVFDQRNIAPQGWHVSTAEDWETLFKYINPNLGYWGILAAKTDWPISYNSINNSSGFAALPSGDRIFSDFRNLGIDAIWWTSTIFDTDPGVRVLYQKLNIQESGSMMGSMMLGLKSGLSIRCVKDN